MIVRHGRNDLWKLRVPLKARGPHDSAGLGVGLPRARHFHASKPQLIVNEALQLSSTIFYFAHDASGLSWGLSIPLTAGLCQLAFTPLHYIVERNKNIRARGAILLAAYKTAFQEQVLRQKNPIGTEADAASVDFELKKRLKVKSRQIQEVTGYKGIWLNFILLSYIPVWISNVSALVEMCGLTEDDSNALPALGLNGVTVEPALTTDGMLWFTDLTIADPLGVLPLATGCLFLASISQVDQGSTGKPTFTQSAMIMFALFSGPLFIATGISNAVLLAMTGSTIVTIVRRSVLDRFLYKSVAKFKPAQPRTAVLKKQYQLIKMRKDKTKGLRL